MILAMFLIGMALCALILALIHAESTSDEPGNGVVMFAGWCAFALLLMGGTWGLGIVISGIIAAVVLVFRTTKFGKALSPLAPYKTPLGIGALVCSVLVWAGVFNMMEGLPNG